MMAVVLDDDLSARRIYCSNLNIRMVLMRPNALTVVIAVTAIFARRKGGASDGEGSGPRTFIECPACGKVLHPTITRCPYCSAFLEVECPNCDRITSRTNKTCPYCGTSLGGVR
jgi:ribosomal protein S27E